MAGHAVITFVGAGPGAADLLTLRGAAALAAAEIVIYAGSLVPEAVLSHCRPGAELIDSSSLTLEDVCAVYARRRPTVRLHSGDLAWYSSMGEQAAWLDQEGIPWEAVPGVTATAAAAAALGVELTVPEVAQTVVITRMGFRTPMPEGETVAVHLGASRPKDLAAALADRGFGPDTPCAVCYRVSWPDEELATCRLDELADAIGRMGHRTTVLVLCGPGLARAGTRSHLYSPAFAHGFRKRAAP